MQPTVSRAVNVVRHHGNVHYETLLDLVQDTSLILGAYERNSQTLGSETTGTTNLEASKR